MLGTGLGWGEKAVRYQSRKPALAVRVGFSRFPDFLFGAGPIILPTASIEGRLLMNSGHVALTWDEASFLSRDTQYVLRLTDSLERFAAR